MGDRTDGLLGSVSIVLVSGDTIEVPPLTIRKAQEWLRKTRSAVTEAFALAQENSGDGEAAGMFAGAVLDAVAEFMGASPEAKEHLENAATFEALYAAYERMLEVADPLSVANAAALRQAEGVFARLKGVPQEVLNRVIVDKLSMAGSGAA